MRDDDARIYLDHNATSPLRRPSRDAMEQSLDAGVANPSSLHAEGRAARARLDAAREDVAALAGVAPKEVVFTSGGSEAVAAAFRGVCDRAPTSLRRVVVSSIEHSAVMESAAAAERRGFEVARVPCDELGRVDAERFADAVRSGAALAVLQWANNETGVIQPVEEVGRACRRGGVPFFVDAVQAAGKIPLDMRGAHADLMALSGHKLGGPQGTGALIVRDGITLERLIPGGAQEKRRRGGTQAVVSAVGFGAAAKAALGALTHEGARLLKLRAKIETRLRAGFPGVRFHGEGAPRLPNTVNFALPDVPGEVLAIALDLAAISVSTGSACASGAVEPSHVIQAMGFDEEASRGAVRVSLGWSSTTEEVDRFLGCLPRVVEQVLEGRTA